MLHMIHETKCLYICGSLQDGVTEDDIDDSFKSMFAQLAGEVSLASLFAFVLAKTIQIIFI